MLFSIRVSIKISVYQKLSVDRFTVSKILQATTCVHIETLSYTVEAAEKMMNSTNKENG